MLDLVNILISQYWAALAMFKQTVLACPDPLWNAAADGNKFWNVAYHALFFTHLYLQDAEEKFTPWRIHRDTYEDFTPAAPVEPYTKAEILAYCDFCWGHVAERVPVIDFAGHFDDRRPYNNFELQIYSIRHLMQHTGELMERLAGKTDAAGAGEIEWVGSQYSEVVKRLTPRGT